MTIEITESILADIEAKAKEATHSAVMTAL